MKFIYLLSFLFLPPMIASPAGVLGPFLRSYNVPNATYQGLVPVNVTLPSGVYTVLYKNATPYFVINVTTSNYSFVFDKTDVFNIIRNKTIDKILAGINLNMIGAQMGNYIGSSSAPLNDCIVETGSDRGTCTPANYCNSCQIVPACNKVLYKAGGPTGTFGIGIANFQANYTRLKNSFALFYSSTSNITRANYASQLAALISSYNNISSITQNMGSNPVFPPPPSANLASCQQQPGALLQNLSTKGPWYCNAIGYCQFLTYNNTLLAIMQVNINLLASEFPTNSTLLSMAANVSIRENAYVTPILYVQKTAQFRNISNTTLLNYSSLVNNTQMLLTRISDYSLGSALLALQQSYFNLESNYLSLNLTSYSLRLSSQLSNLTNIYNSDNASYTRLLHEAKNNTALIIEAQLNPNPSPKIAALAFQESELDNALASPISNLTDMQNRLDMIKMEASQINRQPVLDVGGLTRSLYSAFVTFAAQSLGMPYSTAVRSAPVIAAFLPVAIGAVILLLLLAFRHSLKKSRRIVLNRETSRVWRMLLLAVVLAIAVFIGVSYLYAGMANSSAPFSPFESALHNSKNLAIVLNSTASQPVINCSNALRAAALSINKNASIIRVSGQQCSINNSTAGTGSSCFNLFARKNSPMIVLTNSNATNIRVYSMYGTVLYASGNQSFMNACYISSFLR